MSNGRLLQQQNSPAQLILSSLLRCGARQAAQPQLAKPKAAQPISKLGLSEGPLQLLSPPEAPIPEVAGQQCRQQGSSEDGWSLWLCAPNL